LREPREPWERDAVDPKVKDGVWEVPEKIWLTERKPKADEPESVQRDIDRLADLLHADPVILGNVPVSDWPGLPLAWLKDWRAADEAEYQHFADLSIDWNESEMLDFQRSSSGITGGRALPGWDERRIQERRARELGQADSREVLHRFLSAGVSTPKDILAFATRYGPLRLCRKHGHPIMYCVSTGLAGGKCWVARPESLMYWKYYSRHARAIVRIANALRGLVGETDQDWAVLLYHGRQDIEKMRRSTPAGESPWDHWAVLSREIQRWLQWGGVKPWFEWTKGRQPSLDPVGDGLFGAIAKHLAFQVLGSGSAICFECGTPYKPTRKPRSDQRNFCLRCRKNKVPQRLATRDLRERERARHTRPPVPC
jgi:hypothetical protein